MSTALAETPSIIPCMVRRKFLFDQNPNEGGYVDGFIFGFCARPGRVPAFQVMLEDGSQWAQVPIHMLCWKECAEPKLDDIVMWDCYGFEFSLVQLEFLRNMRCEVLGASVPGECQYQFTVEWMGGWAEIADQHKNHHVVMLSTGHFGAFPNNKLRWLDPSWIKPFVGNPGYKANSHLWSVGK